MSVPNPATTPWVPLWDTGAGGSIVPPSIPGEVKLWGGKVLPAAEYGKWVWADGTPYSATTYPKAATNIAPEWKTAHGQADPGAGQFRVPDLRGLTPVGLDQMPGGSRANRLTRAVSIIVAAKTGEETHIVTIPEMPNHAHGGGYHDHGGGYHGHTTNANALGGSGTYGWGYGGSETTAVVNAAYAGLTAQSVVTAEGGGGGHETMQPSVFVPYIVALDG